MSAKKLYLAGPLHQAWQRQYLEALTAKLEQHYQVYLPHRDGGRYVDLLRTRSMEDAAKTIYNADTVALLASDLLLAVAFGKHFHDPGVCLEVGFARCASIPCYALAPDLDTSPSLNPMLRASFRAIYSTWGELPLPIANPITKG